MDNTKSRYESRACEVLHALDPDESIGSVDELGWAGLYRQELSIILEDSDGFVWIEEYPNAEALAKGWRSIEEEYEEFDLGLLV